jgi:hypothetical protein
MFLHGHAAAVYLTQYSDLRVAWRLVLHCSHLLFRSRQAVRS